MCDFDIFVESWDTYRIIIERPRIISQLQPNFIRKYYTHIYFRELTFTLVECHTKSSQKNKKRKEKENEKRMPYKDTQNRTPYQVPTI